MRWDENRVNGDEMAQRRGLEAEARSVCMNSGKCKYITLLLIRQYRIFLFHHHQLLLDSLSLLSFPTAHHFLGLII
jgi:hypothetical protein